jgi:uncharacterized protein (DUF1501 family)
LGGFLLQARRLVEAGVPVVTVSYGSWDTHGDNFKIMRCQLPRYDRGLAAYLSDLADRGLDKDVLTVVWGEMGRDPRINEYAGRHHWGTGSVLMAGGGLKMGQVIGATDARAQEIKSHVYTPQNVLATIYRFLDIDPKQSLTDFEGRPRTLLDDPRPIQELMP